MSFVTSTIGWRFERVVKREFSTLIDHTKSRNTPDFEHELFWVEAKTALDKSDYGIIPKKYQLRDYPMGIDKPLVYFCGFHNLHDPSKRITQKTERGRKEYVTRNMDITHIFIISHEIMERIDEKHRVLNRKGNISYTGIPSTYFQRIICNDTITQYGTTRRMEQHLGIDLNEMSTRSPEILDSEIPYGWILHRDSDAEVIDFLKGCLKKV